MARSDLGVISQPCPVFWDGWRTTTTQLQQAGWELSAEQVVYRDSLRLMIRHRPYHLYGYAESRSGFNRYGEDRTPGFVIRYMASEFVVNVMDNFSEFTPIDAYPQMIARKSIEDFNIFATPLARTEEIIIEPKDVMYHLEQIKKMQSPEQAEIRKRSLRRNDGSEARPRQVFHAQIISLADHREAA